MVPDDIDEDAPLDPAESLRLIERERAETERSLTPDPRIFLWPWGFAWLIGFTVFFLRFGPDGRIFVNFPEWLPLVVLMGSIFAAGIYTGVRGARSGRWVTGPSSRQGAMYGITWSVAFCGMSVVLSRVSSLLPEPEVSLLWSGVMVGLTAALHMVAGVLYKDTVFYYLGIGVSAANVAGVIAGPGWHSLIIAVLGGGGMLAAGAIAKARLPR
ncbi:transporter [Actinoplanes sp. NPDC051633]|uniref:transporter n=1 Tax=Actinoplanes sp. NPDC051633 TaxID=3155670 RepID=UPI0034344938